VKDKNSFNSAIQSKRKKNKVRRSKSKDVYEKNEQNFTADQKETNFEFEMEEDLEKENNNFDDEFQDFGK